MTFSTSNSIVMIVYNTKRLNLLWKSPEFLTELPPSSGRSPVPRPSEFGPRDKIPYPLRAADIRRILFGFAHICNLHCRPVFT